MRIAPLALIALFAAGCGPSAHLRTFNYQIANDLDEPITIFLTKTGPPLEPGWLAPEQLATAPLSEDSAHHDGRVVPPKTQLISTATGKFVEGSDAVVRIYRLTGTIDDFAAISPGSPKRADVLLQRSDNSFVVSAADDYEMTVKRVTP